MPADLYYTIFKSGLEWLGQIFLLVDLQDFFSDLGWGDEKKSSENDQVTGHFQSFFFNISRTNSKTNSLY